MKKLVSRGCAFGPLALAAVVCLTAQGQLSLEREPLGPSTRKTGLVLTEIMYHPGPALELTNLLQFVEVYNSKPWDEDLSGFSLDGAVHYQMPTNTVLRPGAFLVLARNPSYLQTNSGVTNVLGPWDGASTNGLPLDKGLVRLRNRQGAVLLEVNYADSPPWPISAAGKGHSLVLARPSFGEDEVRAWAQSDTIGGSPGRADPVPVEPLAPILLNEWSSHTDLPLRDFIEVYNHGNTPVDLSGAYLSDSSDTNKFRIPNNTVIPARGFRAFDDSVLGFRLFAGGERLYLVNSNQTRVIDAIDYRGQSNIVSSGRWPDGGPYHYGLANRTPGAANSVPMRYAVVINEIMYNPISGDGDDEYVEIYNRSGGAANLAGWSFVSGITYTFPTNAQTVMPAGTYFVVAKNPTNLMSIYTNLSTANTFGPYTGTLANGGERLTLAAADYDVTTVATGRVTVKLDIVVSDLTYGDGGRWGNWSDGAGASLELIDPEADPNLPSNWADSDDTGESQWTDIEFTGPLGETLGSRVNDSVILILQGIGECLVDEVEVRVDNGPNLVVNGGFESGLTGWTAQGSHDFSTLESLGFMGSKSLHLRAGSRGDNQSNRILSAPFAAPIPPTAGKVSIRAKAKWLRGHPELLVRLHGGGAEAYGRMALPKRLGTPGQVNSRRVANAGPGIFEVKHAPLLPAADAEVVVTARATDPQGVATLKLRYRVDPTPTFTDVVMRDDGSGGDAIANDGIYSAALPGQAAGTMVAFYLEARDTSGATSTFPTDVFPPAGLSRCWPNDAVARECVVRWGEVQMPGDFGTYHLWVTAANSNRWHHRAPMDNTAVDGTFVYNNSRLIYNALPLFSGSPWHRTNSTTGPAGPNRVDYEMNFPGDDPLLGATDFVLNNPGNPDILITSDLSALAEQTVYRVMGLMGLIENHRRYIHFFVNGNQRSSTTQREGNFIFEDSQQPNGDMIAQWFPEDAGGQLFKVDDWFEFEDNGFDIAANNDADLTRRTILLDGQPTLVPAPYRFMFRKRSVSVGSSANDYSPIFALVDAASPADNPTNSTVDPAALGAVADWEQWMRVMAIQRAVGNWDSYGWRRGKNDYWYKPASGPFRRMTWDIDYSMGLGGRWDEPLFESNDPRVVAMFNTPELVRAYWRGFADLVAGPFTSGMLEPFIESRSAALVANDINIDLAAVEAIKTYIGQRQVFLQAQLLTVTVPFAVLGPTAFETTNNLLVITGTAPVNVTQVLLNGVVYPVTWINPTNFVLRVGLASGVNDFVLTAQDRFGVALPEASQSLSVTCTGPDVNPVGSLVITEILFSPAVPRAQFVEIVNRSAASFDLTGWQLEGLNYTFPLSSIVTNGQTVVLARDRIAFRAAYGSVPVFGVFGADLSTQGQRLALLKPVSGGTTVVTGVRYETAFPWPAISNGVSLQLIDLSQDNGRAANWTTDPVTRATPGLANSVVAVLTPFDPLWLNEVQVESLLGPVDNLGQAEPWVELYNAGTLPVSLEGYFLTDTFTNLTQWAFPAGTSLNPGERRLIWADGQPDQADGTNLHASFRLQATGKLALSRLLGGQPQLTDHLAWSKLRANLSYGTYAEGQPAFRATFLDPTPGGPNLYRAPAVRINEWMTKNTLGIGDPADGQRDDWFELYNAETFAVDLGGYYLTDHGADPTKYRIPTNGQYRIPAGGFLLVWADNTPSQNRADRADLHVNFQLSASSGDLGLFLPDGLTPVDLVTYGQQTNDVSEGRLSDGAAMRCFMTNTSPRTANSYLPYYNSPPTFHPPTNQFVAPGQSLTSLARATDVDRISQTLVYSFLENPAGSTISSSGVFRWVVPTNQPLGTYPVTVLATDTGIPPRSDTLVFSVTVRATNAVSVSAVTRPVLDTVGRPAGQLIFSIATLPEHTYRVLYKDNLGAPVWTQLAPDFVASGTTASITDPADVPQRFYRVLQVQ